MICRMQGRLVAVKDGAAQVQSGDLTYEVLVPAADSMMLAASVGETVCFHTLHYLEGQGQGTSFWPRLIGFQSAEARDFFELFTTVKGIGNRRALRALQLPFVRVAQAIVERDLEMLQTLPEIGKRTAEAICVELKGKIDAHAAALGRGGTQAVLPTEVEPKAQSRSKSTAKPLPAAQGVGATRSDLILMANSAVEVLVQLGHSRPDARDMVERALASHSNGRGAPATASELVTAALR